MHRLNLKLANFWLLIRLLLVGCSSACFNFISDDQWRAIPPWFDVASYCFVLIILTIQLKRLRSRSPGGDWSLPVWTANLFKSKLGFLHLGSFCGMGLGITASIASFCGRGSLTVAALPFAIGLGVYSALRIVTSQAIIENSKWS